MSESIDPDSETRQTPRVYIETSIVGYLRQRPSGQVVAAARQFLTRTWWEAERENYELVTSQYVLDEAARGNPILAKERLAALSDVARLKLTQPIADLVNEMMSRRILPANAGIDAFHIAMASVHKVDYLLTWNCAHIANARNLRRIRQLFEETDRWIPQICTPEELLGYDADT